MEVEELCCVAQGGRQKYQVLPRESFKKRKNNQIQKLKDEHGVWWKGGSVRV